MEHNIFSTYGSFFFIQRKINLDPDFLSSVSGSYCVSPFSLVSICEELVFHGCLATLFIKLPECMNPFANFLLDRFFGGASVLDMQAVLVNLAQLHCVVFDDLWLKSCNFK